jgi:fructose-bisphosphate aldolase class I
MQGCGLVPIVEPEILIDGDYSLQRSAEVSQRVLQACLGQLWRRQVDLEATLLKPMMVMPGADAPHRATPQEVACATLDVLRRYLTLSRQTESLHSERAGSTTNCMAAGCIFL